MNGFEISIKSAPHGSVVTVKGSTPTIIVRFGILENSISERCGIPRELLMMAVLLPVKQIYDRKIRYAGQKERQQ